MHDEKKRLLNADFSIDDCVLAPFGWNGEISGVDFTYFRFFFWTCHQGRSGLMQSPGILISEVLKHTFL